MASKNKRVVVNAVAHIHASQNNTIVTFADPNGEVISWSSAGAIGYKGSKKSTPYAAGLAADAAGKKAMENGVRSVSVAINGTGQGKDTAVRSIKALGIEISEIKDRTPIPHNGCRPPKKPR